MVTQQPGVIMSMYKHLAGMKQVSVAYPKHDTSTNNTVNYHLNALFCYVSKYLRNSGDESERSSSVNISVQEYITYVCWIFLHMSVIIIIIIMGNKCNHLSDNRQQISLFTFNFFVLV